jgi:hypothetical protein
MIESFELKNVDSYFVVVPLRATIHEINNNISGRK